MKKILSLVLCLCMLCTVVPAMAFTAGEYTATGAGMNGDVEVIVTFDADKIVDIKFGAHAETPGLSDPAFAKLPEMIIAGQTLAVDVVSGATFTSKAILEAVEKAVVAAGGDAEAMKTPAGAAEVAKVEDEVLNYDVVVIGGGAAGLAAAAEAKDAGANVLLLEKMATNGGNTLISGGVIYATGTKFQKEAGVEDSVEALVDYWYTRAEGNADKDFLTLVAEKSNNTIEWLMENGVEMTGPTTSGISPVPRMQSTNSGGAGFIVPVTNAVKARGVDVRYETPAVSLIMDAGKCVGVEAVAADGHKVTVYAKNVIIATGGFDGDRAMMRKYAPEHADDYFFAAASNTGDGIKMAMAVGADTVFKGGVIGLRGIMNTSFADATNGLVWMPYLMVDQDGARFVNEATDYPIVHTAMCENNHSYLIGDATQLPAAMVEGLIDGGYAFVADTLEELAAKTFMNKDTFLATVARYNELKGQEDVDFGKPAAAMTGVGEGPYAAVRVMPATIGTLGGIKVDLEMHVLDTNGAIIPGLYAAGACANGDFFYKEYPASGTSIMMCFTVGRIAGANAAK